MVALGVTTMLPEALTLPMPIMVMVVAPVTFQDKVLLWPAVILAGLAEKFEITGGGGTATVTATGCATVPPALVALKV